VRIAAAVLALTSLAALPGAAQTTPTQIQLLDGMMHPVVRAGAVAPGRPLRAIDNMGMPVPGTTIRFSWSTICGPMPPFDVMTDSMGMAMTPPFTTGVASGTCTVSMELLASMMTTMYMVQVYNTPDIVIMQAPGPMVDSVAGGMFQLGLTASVNGYALMNAPVSFTVNAPGAANVMMLAPMMTMTDPMGSVMASATANMMTGSYEIKANVDGATATFAVNQRTGGGSTMPMPPMPVVTAQASGASPAGTGPITVSLLNAPGCSIGTSQFIGMQNVSAPPPPVNVALPHGIVSLALAGCSMGQSVDVAIDYPEAIPSTAAFWRYGSTAGNLAAHWYMLPATIDGHRLRVTIADGMAGDGDMMRNGSIGVVGGVGFPGGVLQDLWWSASAENGWGMSIVQHRDTLFAVVYAYDAQGQPTWYAMPGGVWNASHTAYSGALYQPHGTPFFQYDAARLSVGGAVGAMTLTFMDSGNAMLDYTIGGASGRKSIVRQIYATPDLMDRGNHADMWWGGAAQSGWGVALMQQYSTPFAVWFTYDVNGDPRWYVVPSGTWTSADTYEGRLYRTASSAWAGVAYDPSRFQAVDVGALRLRFTGDSTSFDYVIDGRSGTLSLSRQPF